ncbi:MAG: hypothetical protein ABR585_03585 [Gemmatimonadaceae bacterium]
MRHTAVLLAAALAFACHGDTPTGLNQPSSDLGTMAVGEVRVFAAAGVRDGLQVPAASALRDYVIVVANTNPRLDQVATYYVNADVVSAIPVSSVVNQHAVLRGFNAGWLPGRQEIFDSRLRAFERSALTMTGESDPNGVLHFRRPGSANLVAASVPAVGDVLNVKIPDAATDSLCKNFISTQAVVAAVGRRAIIAVDTLDGPPSALFTQSALDSISQEFDNTTFPTDSSYFGNPTDIDANAHIILLYSGQINKLTPPGLPQGSGFIGGFFFAGDFFPTTAARPAEACAQSNRAEILYLLSPDPTGRFGNVRTTASVRQATRGTVAHEFQHMINSGNRYLNPRSSAFEAVWLDEALAHFAEDAVGRAERGFGDLQTLTLGDLLPAGSASANDDFNAFFFQNFARLAFWMVRPDTSSGLSGLADRNLSSRGAAWSIVRYVADNLSDANPRAFTRRTVAGPDTGIANLTAAANAPLDTILSGWFVSMFADHGPIPGLSQNYQLRAYDLRNIMPPVANAVFGTTVPRYPLQITPIGSGSDSVSATVRSGTGTYYRLTVPANSGPKIVTINGERVTLLDCCIGDEAWRRRLGFPGAHVYVLRLE